MSDDFLKVNKMKEKIMRISEILIEAEKISKIVNVPKKIASFKRKFSVSFGVFFIGTILIKPFETNESLYSFLSVIVLSISIYVGFYKYKIMYEADSLNETRKKKLADEFNPKWIELFSLLEEVYLIKLIPMRYLNKENLDYIIECFEYNRVNDIPYALDKLDAKLRHEELIYTLNCIEASNDVIVNELKLLNIKVDVSNINLQKLASSPSLQDSFKNIMTSLVDVGFMK